jgi:hypothetical protein
MFLSPTKAGYVRSNKGYASFFAWVFAATATFAVSAPCLASPMDPSPERFITNAAACQPWAPTASGANPPYCVADEASWVKFATEYAMALAPTGMHPARTTGYGGVELAFFTQFTTVSADQSFWQKGTEGAPTATGNYGLTNPTPDSLFALFGLTARKGLPYGFELQGSIAYVNHTQLSVLGGGIRWSPFEGFRPYVDVSVGGYVNTMAGTNKMHITVPSVEAHVSRAFTISRNAMIQPYVGWQMLWLFIDSGVVDLTPTYDPLANCVARPPTPAEIHIDPTTGKGGYTGQIACNGDVNDRLDLNNNHVFRQIHGVSRMRLLAGVHFRYESAFVLAHVIGDILDPAQGTNDSEFKADYQGMAKQVTIGLEAGVTW